MSNQHFIEECLKEALLMQGQLVALQDERKDIVERVEKAKRWLAKQPEYLKFLQHLQTALHHDNIGIFSELLSYFVKDVLKKDKEIVFELYTYHNLPALRIEAKNEGQREDIVEGNGGSIANIVSTGLRLIALSRLQHRQFIVLDEPDCWLKPEHVPLFAKIIGEISSKLGIQTIIISHHHWSYFKDYGRVIELKKDGPHLTTEIIHDTPATTENDDYIKTIILRRFMSHYDTLYELHPHLTCIIGENDIGKSVLATALKAVNYGDSSDSYIMHHEQEAQVYIGLSNNKQVLWQRFLTTTQDNPQKVKYTLLDNNVEVRAEFNSSEPPVFIKDVLNISTTEDIDVHIGNQKDPVFLLSKTIKPQQRAKILSLGKESLILQKMMENVKSKSKEYKQTEKEGEKRFAIVEHQIKILSDIDVVVSELEQLKQEFFIIEKSNAAIVELNSLIAQMEKEKQIASIAQIENVNIELPVLHDVESLERFIREFEVNSTIAAVENIDHNIELPVLHDVDSIVDLINGLEKLKAIKDINLIDNKIELPQLHDIRELNKLIEQMEKTKHIQKLTPVVANFDALNDINISQYQELMQYIGELETAKNNINGWHEKSKNLEQWKVVLDSEMEAYLNETGHVCPTCKQHIDKEHIMGEVHA